MLFDLIKAVVLGVVEGFTEFLPVSSTGHLLLLQHFFGFSDDDFGKTFVVLIQLGAILAILSIYFARLWQIALGALTDPAPRRFIIGVLIAFLPAAIIGALAAFLHQGRAVQPVDRLRLADRRRRRAAVGRQAAASPGASRRDRVPAADLSLYRAVPVPRHDPGRVALRRHDRVGDAARRRQARGGGVLVLPRDAHDGGRVRLRPVEELRPDGRQQLADRRGRLHRRRSSRRSSW